MLFDQILAVEFLFRKLLCGVLMYELEYYRREGNEKHNTDKAEELAAKQCRKERPQRRKPHAAANHMRVNELIFRELHRLIDDQALATIHAADEPAARKAVAELTACYTITPDAPPAAPFIKAIIR